MNFSGQDLTCVRGGRTVFHTLSFHVAAGDALLLRGPNGCGKSSLLRLVAGFQAPASGTFQWDEGAGFTDPDRHRERVCYAGHLDAVKPALTVAEGLQFWVDLAGGKENTDQALRHWGLGAIADLPGAYLSAGQRKRLNLARLSVSRAELWLLDEPTVSLDDAAVKTLAEVIHEHQAKGGLAMIATHMDLDVEGAQTLNLEPFARAQ